MVNKENKENKNKINKKKVSGDMLSIAIPQAVENLQLPDSMLMTFYKNLENRILWLDSEVDDYFLEYGKYILMWNQEDVGKDASERKPIRLLFFSPGGSLDINNAMIDIIEHSITPVIGINMGIAQSAGAFIFLSCKKRYSMPKAGFLLHRGQGGFSGSYDEIISQVMEYQRQIEELESFVLSHTKIDEETFADNFGSEWFIDSDKALEYGMIDKVIESIDEIYN